MKTIITRIKRLALALCFVTPLVSWAATSTYSTDHTVTGSATAYTSSAGNANVTWQNFNFRAAVDKDHLAHGYYFYLKDGDTDIGETDAAVKLDSITLTWGGNAGGGIGASDTPYLVVTTADDTPVIIGVSAAGAAFSAGGTSTFAFSDVVLASNAKYRFYFYKNDVSGLTVGATLSGAVTGRVNARWHNTSGDKRADYNDIRCDGGAGYSVNCSFVVSPLEDGDATVLETSTTAVSVGSVATPVVIEGKVADGIVDVGSAATVSGVFTVCGEATTLELTDSLTATAFYFPATVTIDASAVSGLDPTGEASSKTTALLSGAVKYTTAPTVILPAATAGMIYETNITSSGISVTVVKGSDCVETISGNTSWSTIKPAGWIDSSVGDKPAIAITYEGEDPVTLTFDEAVQAGSLTLTGNIVVEASAAATFGTVNAGAGSVVEMANMTITTQSGSGVYRYRSDYPSAVPNNNLTYEYVGTADPKKPGTVNLNGMRGTVRTTGYMSITGYYPLVTNARLDVVSGTTTLTAGGQAICGYITIREGATLVNTATDSLAYSSYNSTIDIYGTLDMGTSRWSTWSGAAINLRGGEVVGAGEGNNGAIDLIGTGNVTAYADSTISANIKFRNALSNVTVNDGVTLTISGATKPGYDGGGITKKGNGTLKFTSDPYVPGGIVVEDGTLAFDTESDVDPVVTYAASVLNSENMDYAVSNNWKGTVIVSAVTAGNDLTQVALKKTGNENSYLTLNGISGNAWCADSNYTVQPAITLAGDVNFQNGYSNKAVTFRKIAAGTGNLSLKSWSNCTGITYGFTTLDADNYTGTIQLDGSVLTFNVGNILKAGAAVGDKVLPLTVANNATVNLSNAKLNGEAADLEVKSDGIYVAESTIDVTVPVVDNTVVTVTVGGETVSPKTEGGNVYAVAPGSVVTVTYAAADGYKISGTTEYTVDTASATTFEITDTATAQYVAQIKTGATTYEKYTTLADALDSENAAYGITLLADVTETAVVVDSTVSILGNYTINSNVTIADGGLLRLQAPLNGTLTIQGGGTYVPFGDTLGNVVVQDGGIISLTSLSEDAASLTVPTLTVNGALTIVSSYGQAERGKTYKAISYVTENATIAEGASFNGKDEWSASTTVDGDYTVVCLEITKVAVVDDVYYDTAQEAVDAAVASGEPARFLVQPGTVTLGAGETLVVTGGYQPTVTLKSGLTTPPYEITSSYDLTSFVYTYTVNDVAPIKYYNTWSVPNVFYFADEDPVPSRTTQGTVPKIKREGDSAYHAAEDWVTITWTVTASSATDASTPDDTIATVDENGLVTFTAPGTVKVWLTMTDPSGATKSASKTVKYAPAPAVVVSADGQTKTAYSSLYAAFNGAATSEKIVLGADATVGNIGKMELKDGRSITLDLDGHTVTFNANYGTNVGSLFNIKSGSLAVVDTGATKGGIAATGTGARVFSMETADEATTALSIGEGVNVSSADEVCVYLQGAATLTTAGNLTAASDFAICGNGSAGKEGTTVNVTGGTVTGDEIAIYQPQNGALTISGGAITGGTAVYVKSGTVSVTGGTITGNGAAADYVFNGSGANVTGDAIVIDNAGYPGGAPAPSITGGTFISVNASAIASYSKSGYSRITKFAAASLKTSSITETVASSADVFDDYSSGIDPTDPTSTQEVTVDTSLTAEEQEAAAIEAATVTVPDGVSGVDAATYKTYFTYSATPTATAGTYTVAITGLADEVTETADGNALAALEAATAGGTLSAEVAVKPGLYYGTVAGADVTTLKAPAGTLNTTGKLDLSGVTKPSTGEAFFIKIKVGTTAFAAEE